MACNTIEWRPRAYVSSPRAAPFAPLSYQRHGLLSPNEEADYGH